MRQRSRRVVQAGARRHRSRSGRFDEEPDPQQCALIGVRRVYGVEIGLEDFPAAGRAEGPLDMGRIAPAALSGSRSD